ISLPLDSLETSSDSSFDDLSNSSSGHLSSDHSSPALPSGMRSSHQLCSSVQSIPHSSVAITKIPSHSSFACPYCKRSRSPTTSVPLSSPITGALSSVRADPLPPPKRIRSYDSMTDLEDFSDKSFESSVARETSLRDDVVVRGSDEPYLEHDIDLEIQAEIDECIAYADALRAKGIDAMVMVETVAREEVEGPKCCSVKMISELERDNTKLRGTLDVASQRVSRLQRRELRVYREMRQIRRFRFYDRMRIARLEACVRRHLGYHP
nr:hypothetical protein [Tanacetum cinerariifolium]